MHPCRVDCQFKTIARLAWQMRAAQKRYFRDRTQEALAASKALERQLDQAMQDAAKTPSPQAEFAFDAPPSSVARASLPVEQDNADEVGDHADALSFQPPAYNARMDDDTLSAIEAARSDDDGLPTAPVHVTPQQQVARKQQCFDDLQRMISKRGEKGDTDWLHRCRANLQRDLTKCASPNMETLIQVIDAYLAEAQQ
jgi:hypothetical protein